MGDDAEFNSAPVVPENSPPPKTEIATPKAEAVILNFSPRAQEIRTQVRKEYGLIGLNIDEDTRYAGLWEEAKHNLMPQLSVFEQRYAGYVKDPMFFLDRQARNDALKQFEIQHPDEYEAYARYGVYLDRDGNPDSGADPFVSKLDFDVEDKMKQKFLDIGKEFDDPRQAISQMVDTYPKVHMQAADEVYPDFRQKYPEKTSFYNSPDLYTDTFLSEKLIVDSSARHSVALEEEDDLARIIHYSQVINILGKDTPKIQDNNKNLLQKWWNTKIHKK